MGLTFFRTIVMFAVATKPTAAPASRPEPSLPHPDKYGGDARKYDTWLVSIKAKLAVDGHEMHTGRGKETQRHGQCLGNNDDHGRGHQLEIEYYNFTNVPATVIL
jgi:hypothetical protein